MSTFIHDSCQATFTGIEYNELHEGYSVNIARQGGGNATRKLACAWGDAIDLAKELKGNTVEIDGNLIYTAAASHPLVASLKVENVLIEPRGISLGSGVWEQAHLTVTYSVPDFADGGGGAEDDELKEESIDITAFNEVIPGEKAEFEDGTTLAEDVYLSVRILEYRVTLYRQPSLPLSTIVGLINKVNSTTWKGLAVGQALYAGADATRSITETGAKEWTINHTFLVSERDHRKRWNPNTSAFEFVELKGGEPIIGEGNFATLGV